MKTAIILISLFLSTNILSQEKIGPYTVWYDYVNKIPKQVNYMVKKPIIHIERKGTFYKSPGSMNPNDLKGSGYDRGHLFPAHLSKNNWEMMASFNMKNVAPMSSTLNRGSWEVIERRVEDKLINCDSIFVDITISGILEKLDNGVVIPLVFVKKITYYRNGMSNTESFTFINIKPKRK